MGVCYKMSLYDAIESSQVAAILTNPRLPDNPIIRCNDAFLRLTGYTRVEVIGRNCRFLAGPGTDPAARAMVREAIDKQQPVLVELLNYRKDGTEFRNALMIAPIFDGQGDLEYFLGSQVAVSREEIVPPSPVQRDRALARMTALTRRQRQILLAMAAGQSTKQIAYDLDLRERTVKMHRAALLKSLGVRTAIEAIRIAIEAGY